MERELNKIELSESLCEQIKNEVVASGLVYFVPLNKYQFYNGGSPQLVAVLPEQSRYLTKFLAPQTDGIQSFVGIDSEKILPAIFDKKQIGLETQALNEMEKGLLNLLALPSLVLSDPELSKLLNKSLSSGDKEKLEFDKFKTDCQYLTSASILRADLLLKEDGKVLCCDPNIIPVGYAITASLAEKVEAASGYPTKAKPDYLEGIAKACTETPDRVSGILTTLSYPNWPSHMVLAKTLRETYGVPFYMIPFECMNSDGTLNLESLNEFNKTFKIESVNSKDSVPGTLIRYAREAVSFRDETKVVNAPGVRVLESQIWTGMVFLPGFKELATKKGISPEAIEGIKKIVVPTLIARMNGDIFEIATDLTKSNNSYDFLWEPLETRLDLLEPFKNLNPNEKPKEKSWYIKTLSTSGKKGVRFTGDGRIDQAPKLIAKPVNSMGLNDGSLFLIQPKVRSALSIEGNESRIKVDLFVSLNSGKAILVDFMATPINQRAAHGGSSTRLGLVIL